MKGFEIEKSKIIIYNAINDKRIKDLRTINKVLNTNGYKHIFKYVKIIDNDSIHMELQDYIDDEKQFLFGTLAKGGSIAVKKGKEEEALKNKAIDNLKINFIPIKQSIVLKEIYDNWRM